MQYSVPDWACLGYRMKSKVASHVGQSKSRRKNILLRTDERLRYLTTSSISWQILIWPQKKKRGVDGLHQKFRRSQPWKDAKVWGEWNKASCKIKPVVAGIWGDGKSYQASMRSGRYILCTVLLPLSTEHLNPTIASPYRMWICRILSIRWDRWMLSSFNFTTLGNFRRTRRQDGIDHKTTWRSRPS